MADSDVALLSHHGKKPYKASYCASGTAQQQQLYEVLYRLAAAGFEVDTDGQRLKVSPSRLLTAEQRDWLLRHKPALVAALAAVSGRWCIEYPRSAVAADSGTQIVVDYAPATNWRRVSREYPGAAVWPAPDGLDVATWIA